MPAALILGSLNLAVTSANAQTISINELSLYQTHIPIDPENKIKLSTSSTPELYVSCVKDLVTTTESHEQAIYGYDCNEESQTSAFTLTLSLQATNYIYFFVSIAGSTYNITQDVLIDMGISGTRYDPGTGTITYHTSLATIFHLDSTSTTTTTATSNTVTLQIFSSTADITDNTIPTGTTTKDIKFYLDNTKPSVAASSPTDLGLTVEAADGKILIAPFAFQSGVDRYQFYAVKALDSWHTSSTVPCATWDGSGTPKDMDIGAASTAFGSNAINTAVASGGTKAVIITSTNTGGEITGLENGTHYCVAYAVGNKASNINLSYVQIVTGVQEPNKVLGLFGNNLSCVTARLGPPSNGPSEWWFWGFVIACGFRWIRGTRGFRRPSRTPHYA